VSEESSQRNERTQKVRDLVWHVRTELEKNSVRVGDVTSFLGKLDERRRELRARTLARENRTALDEALAELDSTQEEIRVVGEEMDRRGEQLLAWEADAAAKLRFHRRLMERAPLGFFLTDENGLIADANEEAARMLGVPSSYLRNKPIVNFVNRRDVGTTRSFVRAVGKSDQVLENVISFRPRGGGPARVTQVRACALERRHERAIGFIVREMREHAGSRDEGAEDRKSSVPPSSAHELRGPIQTIQTALSLLRAALPAGSDDGPVAAHCDSILRATHALTRMVTEVEDAARLPLPHE
jgi:PAS domain S-box-containing protein